MSRIISMMVGTAAAALLLSACSGAPAQNDTTEGSSQSEVQSAEGSADVEEPSADSALASELLIDAGTHEVPATLVVPSTASEDQLVPAVVMLHGTGSQRDEAGDGYVILADELARNGVASLRIDFMGSGDSTAPDEDFDVANAASDAQAAIDLLQETPGIDAEQIGIVGWSQGGIHALNVASLDDRIKAVVTWASPSATMAVTEDQRAEAEENGYFTTEYDWREPMDTGHSWITGMDALDLEEVAGAISVPTLLINGEADDVVPAENADTLNGWIPNSEVLIVPGADHTFNIFTGEMTSFDELVNATVSFFSETLK